MTQEVVYRKTSLIEFGIVEDDGDLPDEHFELICDRSYCSWTIEPERALPIIKSRHYQLLIFSSRAKRDKVYQNYQLWLAKQRGRS